MMGEQKKRIFLYAYDKINLGDDLFIYTIANRYPNVQFYLWTEIENKKTFQMLSNLKIIDEKGWIVSVLNFVRGSFAARYRNWMESRCSASVYIGGSIFMEYPNWENYVQWWKYKAALHPFFVLGANFGPYHTEAYRDGMASVFPKLADICFRDRYSAGLFSDCRTVRCAPDILFSCPMPKKTVRKNQIFVSVINCAERDQSHRLAQHDARYIQNMAALLKRYLEEGCTLVLSSFCRQEGDEAAINRILDAMGERENDRIRRLCYDGTNSDALLASIAESDFVIGSRFHAVIFALNAGRPVLPVIYSDKTKHVLEDLEFPGSVIDLRTDAVWSYEDTRCNRETTAGILPDAVRAEAQRHFLRLDEFLGK